MMTTKEIHIAIKNGKGVRDMMDKYNFSSEEVLFRAIRNLTPSGANSFIKELQKNQKKLDRKSSRDKCRDKVNVENSNVSADEEMVAQFPEEISGESKNVLLPDEVEEDAIDEASVICSSVSIEQLEADEKELSAILCNLEVEHNNIVSKRRTCVQRLEKSKNALVELQRLLREQEKKVSKICEEYNELAAKMSIINDECTSYRELLDDLRKQIADLKKVTIFVYKNGTIEVENAEIPSISEVGIASEFAKLVSLPEAEEFTIKELKTIAKLKMMVNAYKENNIVFELEFDSLEVQMFYETVTA